MSPGDRHDDERIVASALSRFAQEHEAKTPCPSADALAGLAEGRLRPEERASVEQHLIACDDCRAIAFVLAEDSPAARAAPIWRNILIAGAVAAAALITVTQFFAPGWRSDDNVVDSKPDTDRQLLAEATHLKEARPDLFGDFIPLGSDERRAPSPGVLRGSGNAVLLRPAAKGRVLETRPAFHFEVVAGATEHRLSVFTADGVSQWSEVVPTPRGSGPVVRFPYPTARPDLDRGSSYLWEVSAKGLLDEVRTRQAFEIISVADQQRFETARREIEMRAPRLIRSLLLAHLALRHRLLSQAEDSAREALAAAPTDPVARETLRHVLEAIGATARAQ